MRTYLDPSRPPTDWSSRRPRPDAENRSSGGADAQSALNPAVFFEKDKEASPRELPNDLTHESYVVFRRRALDSRTKAPTGQCHDDMDILYQFWSHFLAHNFNKRMYEEFRDTALKDWKERESRTGVRNLTAFYGACLLSRRELSHAIASDCVKLVRAELKQDERTAFELLRTSLQEDDLTTSNRATLAEALDSDLKIALQQ